METLDAFGLQCPKPLMEVVDNASDENNENTRRKATVVPIKRGFGSLCDKGLA